MADSKTTKTKLIFFTDERELTDEQIAEARMLGHLDDGKNTPPPGGAGSGPAGGAAVPDPAGKLLGPNAPDAKSGK